MTPIAAGTGGFDNTDHFNKITVRSNPEERIGKSVAAIAVRVKGACLPDSASADNWVLIKSLKALGTGRKHITMQITATDPPGANELLASAAAEVLAEVNQGYPSIVHQHIGEASDVEARRYAVRYLQAQIDAASRKQFEIRADIPDTLCDKTEPVTINGTLYVLDDWGIDYGEDGAEVLTLIVSDPDPGTGEALYT